MILGEIEASEDWKEYFRHLYRKDNNILKSGTETLYINITVWEL